jgi:hypothetical protein
MKLAVSLLFLFAVIQLKIKIFQNICKKIYLISSILKFPAFFNHLSVPAGGPRWLRARPNTSTEPHRHSTNYTTGTTNGPWHHHPSGNNPARTNLSQRSGSRGPSVAGEKFCRFCDDKRNYFLML